MCSDYLRHLQKISNFVRMAHLALKNGNFVRTSRSGLKKKLFFLFSDCYELILGEITLHPSRQLFHLDLFCELLQ